MNFANIPAEMRVIRQWILWRLEWKRGDAAHTQKPTKIPYQLSGKHASVTAPGTWTTFEAVVGIGAYACTEPCDPDAPIAETGFSGIGFVFTKSAGMTGIDFDNTNGNAEHHAAQLKFHAKLNSYSEFSPSGKGLHTIVFGVWPGKGRRRDSVEIYDNERFFTMTGDIHDGRATIQHRQAELDEQFALMGGPVNAPIYSADEPEKENDADIKARAASAANGDKFLSLFAGNWVGDYPSQSEADLALVDIIVFWTNNTAQIERIYAQSVLGQNPKDNYEHRWQRPDYVKKLIAKARDRKLPEPDVDGLRIQLESVVAAHNEKLNGGGATGKPSGKPVAPSDAANPGADVATGEGSATDNEPLERSFVTSTECVFPPGLVGEIAQYIFDAAALPVRQIALAGAIGLMAGLTGRAYNVGARNSGLNQYIILIAGTGRGKEGMSRGIAKLTKAVKQSTLLAQSTIDEYEGPTQIASSQALSKWLSRHPCIYSIIGEFGIKLRQMADERAPPHLQMLRADLLSLYHKADHGNTWGAMAYAKREENTEVIASPSFTLIAESTPQKFYENVTEEVVTDGLMPRFTIFTYDGDQGILSDDEHLEPEPSEFLKQKIASLVAHCSAIQRDQKVCKVEMSPEAKAIFRDFATYQRRCVNNRDPRTGIRLATQPDDLVAELWNRAHVKAMRLAAVCAVGVNYVFPCIDAQEAMWACGQIYGQTQALLERFKRGDIGGGSVNAPANEAKQTKLFSDKVGNLLKGKVKFPPYRMTDDMIRDNVFPLNMMQTLLCSCGAFKNDRRGSNEAVTRIYKTFVENGDLSEMNPMHMQNKYGKACKAFVVSNPARFVDGLT